MFIISTSIPSSSRVCCYFIVALITDASNRVRLTDLGLSTENQKANGKLETKNTAVVNKKENKQEKKNCNTIQCYAAQFLIFSIQ